MKVFQMFLHWAIIHDLLQKRLPIIKIYNKMKM